MPTAMILAAGLGTRLRPLTDELPKPLVPVGDGPLLAQIERHLARAGIDRVVLNTHHRAGDFARQPGPWPLPTQLVHEPDILGTAGGVANARSLLPSGTPLLVWNGDIFADIDVAALGAALAGGGAVAAWAVAPRPKGQGTVGVDDGGRVVRVRGFRGGDEARGGDFLGVQWLSPSVVKALPARGCLVGDALLPLLERGARVTAVEHDGPWDDVGTVGAYLRANLRWLEARGLRAHLGRGASAPAGAALEGAVLGDGARLEGEARAERVVLWPGAVARGPLADAIVTTSGRVVRAE